MEGNDRLLPRYLRFVQGIIDSHDLPLNVSHKLLQHSRHLDAIRTTAVKKLLEELSDLAIHQPDRSAIFWQAFGSVLKEGINEDAPNREMLATLCRFASTYAGKAIQEAQGLLERLKDALDDEVKEVCITTRLTTSPACLIVDEPRSHSPTPYAIQWPGISLS